MADVIFAPKDLGDWLQYPVVQDSALLAEQVTAGWLKDALGVTELPAAPKGSSLFSWALELGGIAYENPLALMSGSLGDEASTYDRTRRDRILAAVAASAARGAGGSGPRGCFPPPAVYPDPADGLYPPRLRW